MAGGPDRRFTLIFGARHRAGLLYDEEFRSFASAQPNFHYHPTLTRPDGAWEGATGRVQSHVLDELGDRRDVDVYICGLREMVDELRAQLKALGFDRKRIIYEKYD
jgi:CDP-4-dehydro-6-deoxyglucose reductase